MSDPDIVARLRGHIAITTRFHYADDGFSKLVYDRGPSLICQEAADEIERLRNEVERFRKFELEVTRKAIHLLPSVPRTQKERP